MSSVIRSRRQTQRLYDIVAYVVLIGAFSFAVFPILWTLLTSLKANSDIVTAQIQYIPVRPTLQNYATLWAQAGFPAMFFNSAIVTLITVLACLAVGVSGAYSLSRYRFPARGQILLFYLVIRMFPAVLLLLPIFIALRVLGWYDTHIRLALAYTAFLTPVSIWILKGFFDGIPPELEDAAAIETLKFGGPAPAFAGSSNWGLTVVLPNFQRVLLGEIKPEEAVDNMMKGLDKAVKG